MSPEWNATLLRVMLESSLRVCLLAAAVGGILLLGRIRSGSVRHAAWSAVLGAMILMPVLPHWVPAIDVPVPSRARRVEAIPAAIESVWIDPNGEFRDPAAPPPAPAVVASTRESVSTTPPPPRAIWPLALVGVYGAGVLFLLFRLMLGWRAVQAIVRASEPIDRPLSDLGRRTPAIGLLRESALVATPMTVGILAPRILLPSAWKLWPDEKLRAVLAHEFAHVRRRDPLVALLARVNLCLFWFHPVAWWLERKLATTAEHACDDEGLRVMGEKRRYAEVLLDMAEAVRRAGGRVSWDGVGVHGSGLLGQRIDRVLRGELFREVSMTRKIIVALSCAIAIVLVVACRRQATAPAPLRDDPAFLAQQGQNKVEIDLQDAARQMTVAQVAEIEASLQRNPEDLAARKRLLIFSVPYGVPISGEKDKWAPRCAQVIGEQPCIALRRVQILWLIEHHPDNDALGYTAQISPASGNLNDPLGYSEASKLWLAQTARPDASVAVLMNAADFFERADKPLAEKMWLRVQALDPKGPGSRRLGRLYAAVAVGATSVFDRRTADAAEARSPYAQAVRKKLDESRDPRLLAEAAWWLNYAPPWAPEQDPGFDPRAFAKTCAERALQMDPQSLQAHMILVS
jgi:beta-lactamase regulating signal transducer with metallopeptidase domain